MFDQATTLCRHAARALTLAALAALGPLAAAAPAPAPAHAALLSIDGAIGPATTDYLRRSMKAAEADGASLIVLQIDTPGGLDAATRDIIKDILASPLPVISYVHPAGSRAASAGTYILYASHLAAMSPSTTLGAATPVSIGAPGLPAPKGGGDDDPVEKTPAPASAMEHKIVNDAVAYIRGLAQRHGRNADWAERAVRDAATLTAEEALAAQVIDLVANDLNDLLRQADGRQVRMAEGERTLASADLAVQIYAPDWRNRLLAIITDPQVAYILLMIGIYGLILEGYNPGALVPGVVGAICLFIALYALQVLPVNYAGLVLILFGVALIVAEAASPSFGVLGIGGIIAVTLGSLILIDSDAPGMAISRRLIAAVAAASSLLVLAILMIAGRSFRLHKVPIEQALVGKTGRVYRADAEATQVVVEGETWNARCDQSLRAGQTIHVVAQQGLTLMVEPLRGEQP